MKDVYIHPNALVESVNIGTGTRIWAFAHVMKGAVIGANCNVGDHVFIESGAVIGNDVTVKNQCMIWEGVTIEDGVFVGPGVSFTNDLYPRSPRLPIVQKRYSDKNIWLANTHVKFGASLGARTVILPGVEIGEFSMVGAGAVISHDVPAFALAIGNPAKWAGWVCRCGAILHFDQTETSCTKCESRYRRVRVGSSNEKQLYEFKIEAL